MKSKSLETFLSDNFTLFTCMLSASLVALYIILGLQEGFSWETYVIIGINTVYIPCSIIFKKNCFPYYYLTYSLILIFIIAFKNTLLYNNFSALFIMCIVVLYNRKMELFSFFLYFLLSTIAFILNDESLVHFLIHITYTSWFILTITTAIHRNYDRKKLILFNDEKEILNQLCNGKVYQKEVEGFSENTIYRKLKAARERNGNITRDQLVDLYRKEFLENANKY